MSEVAPVEHEVEVTVPLDDARAKMLDSRIKTCVENIGDRLTALHKLLDEAQEGQVHLTMGFRSWTEYLADRIGNRWQVAGDERREMAQLLANRGMSMRAIASITGTSKSTVARVLDEVSQDGTPDSDSTVPQWDSSSSGDEKKGMGLDGKQRRKPKPRKKPEPNPDESAPADAAPAARAVQIPTAYREIVGGFIRPIEDLFALTRDPRWAKAVQRFNLKDRDTLDRTIDGLQEFRAAMNKQPEEKTA